MPLPKLTVLLFAILAATRLPLAPKYLYYFDSVNFALSLEDFNPARHQPQPPGYPMFVGLLRLLHLVIPGAEHVLLVAGIVVATAASVFLWRLTYEMFGNHAALLAISLFLFTPPFWFGGITNQVRVSLALCSAGIALLSWRALGQPESAARLYITFAALGLGAGFRPVLGTLLLPLIAWVWWRTGHSFRRLVIGVAVAGVATAPWIAATAIAVGGLPQWFTLMWTYAQDQFQGSSAAFGAPAVSAWKMAVKALAWNGLAAVAWIWAVPFVWDRSVLGRFEVKAVFLMVWVLPILLFSALIHIGDPDQALGSIPAICLIGGAVLAAFLERISSRRVALTGVSVAAVNAVLFFFPPGRIARASSYAAVVAIDQQTQSVFNAIRGATGSGPAAIVEYRAVVTWRHISYYFPDQPVVSLDANPNAFSWTVQHHQTLSTMRPADKLPGPRRVILVAPFENAESMASSGWQTHGPVYYRDLDPGARIYVGPYKLVQP